MRPAGGGTASSLQACEKAAGRILHRARTLEDLRLPAGNRLEALKGDRAGTFSVRVNVQYRITFRFEESYADDVACEDYR